LSAGDPDATPPDAADGAPRQPGELVSPAEAARAGSAAYRAGDYATAERLWRPLAEAGVARAEYQLGAMYYEGRLGPPDLVAAYGWVGRAAAQGYPPASELLARIAGGMTPRQLEEARRRAGGAPRPDGPPPG
jgi:TPR repeat protein